jgi:positive regulator of sigma E activity
MRFGSVVGLSAIGRGGRTIRNGSRVISCKERSDCDDCHQGKGGCGLEQPSPALSALGLFEANLCF